MPTTSRESYHWDMGKHTKPNLLNKQPHFTVKEQVASTNIHPTLRRILKRFDKVLSQVEDWT